MRVLVFGTAGMLGHKIVQTLGNDHEVWGTVRNDASQITRFGFVDDSRIVPNVDVSNEGSVESTLRDVLPDVVVNAVGIVKQASNSNDVISALTVNSIFPHRLARLGQELGFRLITISTDCVFDGIRGGYTETDEPNARDLYGISKALGEIISDNVLTIRTSIIGRELATSQGLVEWFFANSGSRVSGYARAVFSGFPTIVFADIIRDLIVKHPELNGLYHVSSAPIDKFRLLELIRDKFDLPVSIERTENVVIDRSLNSDRFRAATSYAPLSWEKMIDLMASDPTPYKEWRRSNH
ncbi:MAG TPA: SDR family oxidoreductase [Pyrinomonadaceae bacterium]|nr:SDR family oxidoreductase [Pyrinomonadaceae bacterium]